MIFCHKNVDIDYSFSGSSLCRALQQVLCLAFRFSIWLIMPSIPLDFWRETFGWWFQWNFLFSISYSMNVNLFSDWWSISSLQFFAGVIFFAIISSFIPEPTLNPTVDIKSKKVWHGFNNGILKYTILKLAYAHTN